MVAAACGACSRRLGIPVTDAVHLGDALSALVDGELPADEQAAARRHLDGCPGCRDELAATEAVALAIRGLPPVDAPFGFYERLLRGKGFAVADRRPLRVGLAVATVAAAVALAVGLAGDLGGTEVSPQVDDMVDVHQAGFVPQDGFETVAAEDAGAVEVPREIEGGFEREAVYQRSSDDLVAIAYRSGPDTVSVFEQPGQLDTGALDAAMDEMGHGAWAMEVDGLHAVVADRGRLVYTVVGDASIAAIMALVSHLPDGPEPSLVERARDACTEVVWTFGLGG